MRQRLGTAAVAALIALSATEAAVAQGRAGASCDRACLKGMVDSYLAAVVAHDPSRVPIASEAKFVENTVRKKPGEGLWKTASDAPTTFTIYVPDPESQQVGFNPGRPNSRNRGDRILHAVQLQDRVGRGEWAMRERCAERGVGISRSGINGSGFSARGHLETKG